MQHIAIPNVDIPYDALNAFCRKWHVTQLALFGSVLREDFAPGSDIDVLVTFAQGVAHSFQDRLAMEDELEKLFGRKVDLIKRQLIENSNNPIRRRHILQTAKVIYESPG